MFRFSRHASFRSVSLVVKIELKKTSVGKIGSQSTRVSPFTCVTSINTVNGFQGWGRMQFALLCGLSKVEHLSWSTQVYNVHPGSVYTCVPPSCVHPSFVPSTSKVAVHVQCPPRIYAPPTLTCGDIVFIQWAEGYITRPKALPATAST